MQNGGDGNGGEIYTIAGLTVDVTRELVTRTSDGTRVTLRAKCFDALVYLLRNPDRVVTKAELIDTVWKGVNVTNDTINGCFAEVREVLRPGWGGSEINLTVHGRGHRLPSDKFRRLAPALAASPANRWGRYLAAAGMCVLVAFSALPPAPKPPGIRVVVREAAWWRFDEPAADRVVDSSGNGNSGRLIGGVRRIPGILGNALELDGIDGRVVGDGTGNAFPFGDSPRTISCWIRTAAPPAEDTGILHYGLVDLTQSATNFHLFLDRQGRVGFGNGYNHSVVRSAKTVTDGQWHHISADLLEWPERMCGLFIDGVLDNAERLAVAPMTVPGTPWTIGVFMAGGVPFKGAIDDVRLFRTRLDDRQRQALWTCSSPLVAIPEARGAPGRWFPLPLVGSMGFLGYDAESARAVLSANSQGFAAVQLARSDADCGIESYRGFEFVSGMQLAADLSFAGSKTGGDAVAGPYFGAVPSTLGSRTPPETGGFWIAVSPAGEVELRPLGSQAAAGSKLLSVPARSGDGDRTFHVEMTVRGTRGAVQVNGVTAEFGIPHADGTAAGFAFFQPSTPLFTRVPRIRNITVSQGE